MPEAVAMPALPLTGGCQCGQVRYAIAGVPVVFYLCHCRECQRQTSSAYGESLRVRCEDLSIEGELAKTTRIADSGSTREGWFCPRCGVRIFHGTPGRPQGNIKAGTLDDATWLVPAGHMWTASKQRFVAIGGDELAYPGEPENLDALAARWRAMLAAGKVSET